MCLLLRTSRQVKKANITKQRGRRGFGGPWRAFIRLRTLGQSKRPCLRQLGSEYTKGKKDGSLPMSKLQAMASAATAAGKSAPPRPGRSAFGATSRDLQNRRVADLRAALHDRCLAETDDNRAMFVGTEVARAKVDLDTCLSLARSALNMASTQQRRERQADVAALDRFEDGPGKQCHDEVLRECPWLGGVQLRPVPMPAGILLQATAPDAEILAKAAAWAHWSKASNISGCLDEAWARLHTTLSEDRCGECKEAKNAESECLTAGVCLCSDSGRQLKRLRNLFLSAMKKVFVPHSELRAALARGEVVVRLIASPADGDYEALITQDQPVADVMLHIGLMYFSPYRPTFLKLDLCPIGHAPGGNSAALSVKALCCLRVRKGYSELFSATWFVAPLLWGLCDVSGPRGNMFQIGHPPFLTSGNRPKRRVAPERSLMLIAPS